MPVPFPNPIHEEAVMSSVRPVARLSFVVLAAAAITLAASTARADVSAGLRLGFSSNPDQVLVGGQLNMDPVSTHVYIVPSGEAGFGDDAFTLSFNGDVQYRFDVRDSKVRPYAGGGLTLYYINF